MDLSGPNKLLFCPQCNAPLPSGNGGNEFCARCLLLGVLEAETIDSTSGESSGKESPPDNQIGPYHLIEPIASGGMGEVFIASQTKPVHRLVALKIVKAGLDSHEVLRRFEAERQALAMMDHPNIAHVYDAGTAPSGRPYFVMELVDGSTITEYCDNNRLKPRERLTLFVKVCEAVQHAHQRGIIHRDLKPSNILVEEIDGVPTPKVIDFGIAKAVDRELTERTMETQFGDLLGTPQYMSPEQALGKINEIDTRSDVYSLGVILYELLTGSPPITMEEIHKAGILGIGRLLMDTDPQRPSTRLRSLGKDATVIAEHRGTDSTQLRRNLEQDLDWILLKCIEREKERRYETASALVRELQRHLSDEVVEARPPTFGYRFRKTLKRNKAAFIAGSLVMLAILAGSVLAGWQAIEATRANRSTSKLLSQTYAERGWEKLEAGNAPEALLWQTKAFKIASASGALNREDELPYRQSIAWALAKSPKPVAVIDTPHRVSAVRTWLDEKNGHLFLSIHQFGLQIWDLAEETLVREITNYHPHDVKVDHRNRRFLSRHSGSISLFSFDQPETPIWQIKVESENSPYIIRADFTFDGRYIAALNPTLEFFSIDTATGEILHHLDLGNGEGLPSINMHVSRSDYRVATFCGSRDYTKGNHWWVAVADAASGQVIVPTTSRPNYSDGAAFQPGGNTMLLAENYTSLINVDLEQTEVGVSNMKYWTGNGGERVIFNSTGTRVFSKNSGMINGWFWPEQEHRFVQKPGFRGFSLRPGREDSLLVAQGNTGLLLNTEDGEIEHTFPEPGKIHNLIFPGKKGDLIVTGLENDKDQEDPRSILTVWDLKNLRGNDSIQMADRPNKDHAVSIQSAVHHATRNQFAMLAGVGANVWDTKTGELLRRFRSPNRGTQYRALAMATRGETIAVSDTEGTVQVFDLESGKGLHSFRVEGPVRELAFFPDGTWLAAKEDGQVRVNNRSEENRGKRFYFWNLSAGKLIYQFEASTLFSWKYTIRFSPDNHFAILVTGEPNSTESGTYEATLLDLTTGDTSVYVCDERYANHFNWNPNSPVTGSDRFAFVDDRHFVIGRNCWRISPEKEIEFLGNLGYEDAQRKVAAIPGTNWVAVEDGTSGTFQLWNPKTRAPVSRPIFHGRQILALAAHPNGRTIAVGDTEGGITLWDWRSGKTASPRLLLRNSLEPSRLFFNPDGTHLIAVNRDGLVERWELPDIPQLNPTGLSDIAECLSRRRINTVGGVESVSIESMLDQWRQSPWPELTRAPLSKSSEVWLDLFDGKTMTGWETLEPGGSGFTMQGELLKMKDADSAPQFLTFTGTDDVLPEFRDFILRTQFWAAPDAVGEIYIHSEINRSGHPARGNIIRISGRPHRASGSICDLCWIHDFVARPEQWHELEIEMRGNRITTRIDGQPAAVWEEPPGWKGLSGPDRTIGAGTFVLRIDQGEIFLKEMQIRTLGDQPSLTRRAAALQQLGQIRLSQGKTIEANGLFQQALNLLRSTDPAPEHFGLLLSASEGLRKSASAVGNFPAPLILDLANRYRSLLAKLETGSDSYFELVKNAGHLDAILFEVYQEQGEDQKAVQLMDDGIRWFRSAMEAASQSLAQDALWNTQRQAYHTCLKKCDQVPPSLLDTIEYAKQNFKRSGFSVSRLQFAARLGLESGRVIFEAGNKTKGMQLVEQSLEVTNWLAEREPENFDYLSHVDESRGILANMYTGAGRNKEAAALRKSRYLSMMAKFHHQKYAHKEGALNAAAQRINWMVDHRDSLTGQDWEWITGEVEVLRELLEGLNPNHPEVVGFVASTTGAYVKTGDYHYRLGNMEKARHHFKQGIQLSLEVIPQVDTENLRDTYWRIAGERLVRYRNRSKAWDTGFLQELLDQAEPVSKSNPGLGREQQLLAIALRISSAKVAMQDDLEAAIEFRKRAIVYEANLVEKLPNEIWTVYDLVDDYRRLGDIQRSAAKNEDAERSYQTAVELGEKAVAQFPGNDGKFHKTLGEAQTNLARFYRVTGRKEEAWELYDRAVINLETCAQLSPTDDGRKEWAAGLLFGLGELYQREKKDLSKAESIYRRALAWREMMADNSPQDIKRQTDVARCCEKLAGLLFLKDPKSDESRKFDERVLAILKPIEAAAELTNVGKSALSNARERRALQKVSTAGETDNGN